MSYTPLTGALTSVISSNLTASRALVSDGSGKIADSTVTTTELSHVSGVTSAIQTQLGNKLNLAGGTLTGALTLSADPVSALQPVTLQYFQSQMQGLSPKTSVQVATTASITLSGEQTIDGVLTSSSRVLVKNQAAPEANGIYVSNSSGWTRASDADTWGEIPAAYVFSQLGTLNADTGWVCTSNDGGTLGVTAINFVQFTAAGAFSADGNGIELVGSQFRLELDGTSLSKSASGLKVNAVPIGALATTGTASVSTWLRGDYAWTGIVQADVSGLVTALSGKQATIVGAATTVTTLDLTVSRAVISNASGKIAVSPTTDTELGFLSGVTSAIQTQLGSKLALAGGTMTGSIVFSTGQAIQTNTTATNTLLLQAYNTTGSSYTTFGTLTAGTTPTFDLNDSTTKSGQYIYRVAGTDVQVSDGGTGVSTLTAFAPIFGGTTGTGAVQSGTTGTSGQVLTSTGAGSLPTFQTLNPSFAYVAKTAIYTAVSGDYIIDCTSGTFTVSLPTAVGITGKAYIIKNSGAGVITVDPNSTETIDGASTYALSFQYQSITAVSNGANWIII